MRDSGQNRLSLNGAQCTAPVDMTIASDLTQVSTVIEAFRAFLDRCGVRDGLGLLIVSRELLVNAILYGNQHRVERRVHCRLRRLENRAFEVEVEDEGSGFDYRHVDMSLPEDPRGLEHRGYALICALADELEFDCNGSRIVARFVLDTRSDA